MSDSSKTAPEPEPGGEARASRQSDEGPSTPDQSSTERPTLFERLAGLFRQRNGSSLRDDLADALAETAGGEEAFSPGERAMLNNILRLREVRVEDVMIPRADVEAVEISTPLSELMNVFEKSGHSRMPVYADTLDDPRGMVHIRDIVGHLTRVARVKKGRATKANAGKPAELDLSKVDLSKSIGEVNLIRNVLFVPPSMLASDLMARMQAARTQMALVIDEYGGTDGLVSLEDIVEMVVGDIEDEHDEDEPLITQTGDGIFIVDAKAEIDDVAEKIGDDFKAGEHGDYVDTIGGMIFNALGRVPVRGEVVNAIPGFEFHVLDADPRRVKRVRIVHDPKGEKRRRIREQQA
ncbi:CBS domain-containing protein [Mesorhizobium sp. NBSH29]|uniref:hemolysin family protein n=1 Tax=Mesorhizobium sp. NBSH29 TaxID=2654249 RepID=UPI0018966BD2|nr:hemolysin family protein [Mesorhizobium sp. NBSH29]QPC86512.1 CBS domain-containing protein [Mesorhizobium sp. NBSH29]